jgi:hypothetical protein
VVRAVRDMRGVHLPHPHSAGCLPGKKFPEESSSRQVSPEITVSGRMYWCSQTLEIEEAKPFTYDQMERYQLLMQSYMVNIGHLMEPWIITLWHISNQDLSNNTGLVRLSTVILMCRAISPISWTTSGQTSITSHTTCS